MMRGLLRFLLRVFGAVLALGTLAAAVGAIFLWVSMERLSGADLGAQLTLSEPLRVYSADGLLMAQYGTERRRPVPFEAIPRPLILAVLAAEDDRFYEHDGVDVRGLARAAVRYLQSGEPREGGSTITMQVVRNFLLTPEKTFERKLTEVLMALRLERMLTKDEILALYLNKVFFGHRAYGVAAAAALYYDKPLPALTLAECAMLAAIPKAPSAGNPVTDPQRALARRDYVLDRMLALGYIDRAAHDAARREPNRATLHEQEPELDAGYAAEMARAQVVERFGEAAYRRGYRVVTTIDSRLQTAAQAAVREALLGYDQRHGYRGAEAREPELLALDGSEQDAAIEALLADTQPLPGLAAGLVVTAGPRSAEVRLAGGSRVRLGLAQVKWARPFVTANRRGPAPRRVDAVLHPGDLVRLRPDAAGGWRLSQRPAAVAALLAMAPRDGAIRAMVGGYDFGESQFNRAVHARRQPGSAFKPFVYAAALDRGWTPASLVLDDPIAVQVSATETWMPSNFDHRSLGPIRLRTALVRSRNLASVDLLDRVGVDEARRFITRFGFTRDQLPRGLTLALGAGVVSLPDMARGYAVFANGGFRVQPHLIARVEDASDAVVYAPDVRRACDDCWFRAPAVAGEPERPDPAPAARAPRVLEPRVAYQMHSLLADVIRAGTGRRARALKRADIAGKTGTTNDIRDAWFCGYQKDLVAVAWMGFDDNSPLGHGETGGESALGLWMGFMRPALAGRPEAELPVPPGMVPVYVDRTSGEPVAAGTPGAVREWIRDDYQSYLAGPAPVSPAHLPAAVIVEPPPIIESVY